MPSRRLLVSTLAWLSLAGPGLAQTPPASPSVSAAQAKVASLPQEARCSALALWGEHHTRDPHVAMDMMKMGLFYLGMMAGKHPQEHWSGKVLNAANGLPDAPKQNGSAIAACVTLMRPFLPASPAGAHANST